MAVSGVKSKVNLEERRADAQERGFSSFRRFYVLQSASALAMADVSLSDNHRFY